MSLVIKLIIILLVNPILSTYTPVLCNHGQLTSSYDDDK